MSKKNRFQKHKSRKYRKIHHPPKVQTKESTFRKEELLEEVKGEETVTPQQKKEPANYQKFPKKFETQKKIKKQNIFRETKSDLKKVLTTFLAFAILVAGLYIIKIKTSVFEISVNYLYKIMALSH